MLINCGRLCRATYVAYYPPVCTTLLSMMSRCFSDCDESMRWVVDALMNDKSAMRRWKYYKSVMSRWCVDVFQKFKQCSNDVAMIVNDLRQVPRGKSHIYLSNCANFLFNKLFLLIHLFLSFLASFCIFFFRTDLKLP